MRVNFVTEKKDEIEVFKEVLIRAHEVEFYCAEYSDDGMNKKLLARMTLKKMQGFISELAEVPENKNSKHDDEGKVGNNGF